MEYIPILPHLRDLVNQTISPGRGMRQDDSSSPLLFLVVIDDVMGPASRDTEFEVGGLLVNEFAYADNLALHAENEI